MLEDLSSAVDAAVELVTSELLEIAVAVALADLVMNMVISDMAMYGSGFASQPGSSSPRER